MTIYICPNGIGGSLGDELVTETELYTSGLLLFVHHTGSNINNFGGIRQRPLASLVFALTVAGDGDVICLLDGHTETIDTPITITQNGLKIVGEGTSAGVPTVSLTLSHNSSITLTITGINVALGNIKFPWSSALAPSVSRIFINANIFTMRGCYVESGEGDQWAPVWLDPDSAGCRFYNTTFVSIASIDPSFSGLIVDTNTDMEIEACTFDGGVTGYAAGGLNGLNGGALLRFRAQQTKLLNGAGILLPANTTGYVGIAESTGAPVISGFANRLPNGFRQTGDALLTDAELYLSGDIYYVHYGTGADANSGKDELNPKKKTSSAVGVTGDNCDFVVLLPGHDEPVDAGISLNSNGLTLIGCGTTDGHPLCKIHGAAEGPITLVSTADVSYIRNVWLSETSVTDVTQSKHIGLSISYSEVRGCLLTLGYRDRVGIVATVPRITIRDSKFESTGTGATTRAERAVLLDTGCTADVDVRGCEFSNGVGGFLTTAFHVFEATIRIYAIDVTQSFGADIIVNAAATGLLNPESSSGSSMVSW